MKAPMDQCPHCGSDEGYYTKDYVSGTSRYHVRFDGGEAENGEMYESLRHKPGKVAYCSSCNKRIFKIGVKA